MNKGFKALLKEKEKQFKNEVPDGGMDINNVDAIGKAVTISKTHGEITILNYIIKTIETNLKINHNTAMKKLRIGCVVKSCNNCLEMRELQGKRDALEALL